MRKNNKDRQKLKVYVLYVLHVIHTHDTHHCPLKSNGERAGNLLPVREALAGCRGAARGRLRKRNLKYVKAAPRQEPSGKA